MSAELIGVVAFLGAALFLYGVLGGADFGAGIWEVFPLSKDERTVISRAIAPVWEANHVWLVIAVVILFMGFPKAFGWVSIHLHLPLMAALLGIVVRGTAFTFRHYDIDRRYDGIYTALFAGSSVWTPFFLGLTLGGAIGGNLETNTLDFYGAYLAPWANLFSASLGLFALALFALVAAVFLVGESDDAKIRAAFRRRAAGATLATLVTGGLVFVFQTEALTGLRGRFLHQPLSVVAFVVATLLWVPFWISLRRPKGAALARIFAGAIALMVFIGWYAAQYPVLMYLSDGGMLRGITFAEVAAPVATLRALLGALLVGSLLIFPALGYLLWVYKRRAPSGKH